MSAIQLAQEQHVQDRLIRFASQPLRKREGYSIRLSVHSNQHKRPSRVRVDRNRSEMVSGLYKSVDFSQRGFRRTLTAPPGLLDVMIALAHPATGLRQHGLLRSRLKR